MQSYKRIILPFIVPLSFIYGCFIWIRNQFYNREWINVAVFNKPIISVGNITSGGTGKTPLVIYLAQILQKQGKKPGIISRGYGRKSAGLHVVHDGKKIIVDVQTAGDEPFLMARILNNIPIIVSENRIEGIKQLIDYYYADVIIMDDGFQHRKVKRDLDILTISINDTQYRLLPWGNLREPLKNINRANYIVYTKTNNYQLPNIQMNIQRFIKSKYLISTSIPVLMKYDNLNYKKTLPPKGSVFAFCGIGDPMSFIQSAEKLSLQIKGSRFFNDHQDYTESIVKILTEQIHFNNINQVVTTEKDMVKLPNSFLSEFETYVIKISIEFENGVDIQNLIHPFLFD